MLWKNVQLSLLAIDTAPTESSTAGSVSLARKPSRPIASMAKQAMATAETGSGAPGETTFISSVSIWLSNKGVSWTILRVIFFSQKNNYSELAKRERWLWDILLSCWRLPGIYGPYYIRLRCYIYRWHTWPWIALLVFKFVPTVLNNISVPFISDLLARWLLRRQILAGRSLQRENVQRCWRCWEVRRYRCGQRSPRFRSPVWRPVLHGSPSSPDLQQVRESDQLQKRSRGRMEKWRLYSE